jgi:hypothetical protein
MKTSSRRIEATRAAMIERQKNAWTKKAREERARASAAPEPNPDNDPNPPRQTKPLRRSRERERAVVAIVRPPKKTRGVHFKPGQEQQLRDAVRDRLGWGPAWLPRAEEKSTSKEAAQILNRLHAAVAEAYDFVTSRDDYERRQGPTDNVADYLRWWINTARYEGLHFVPSVQLGGELEPLIDLWMRRQQKDEPPLTDRDLAERALRSGYWPLVAMAREPTAYDVIAQVTRAVNRIRSRH